MNNNQKKATEGYSTKNKIKNNLYKKCMSRAYLLENLIIPKQEVGVKEND